MMRRFKNAILLKSVNVVVRLLIVSDILMIMSRWGLIAPIFAIYITKHIDGGNLEVVGIATTIYLLSKSLLQIPASAVLDRIKGERDDFLAIVIGSLVMTIIPIFYVFIDSPWQLYAVQFVYGLAAAFAFPSWMAIFTRHIDKEREGMEWGMYFTFTDLSTAVAAALGGVVAYRYGFNSLFVVAGIISFLGIIVLFGVKGSLAIAPVKRNK